MPTEADEGGVRTLLQTCGLTEELGGLRVLSGVGLEVAEGTVHALVGRQGAGKTTLLNLLTGFLAPTSGTIWLSGRDITGLQPEQVARLGVARSFPISGLFQGMEALDHVGLALASPTGLGYRTWRSPRQVRPFRDRALDLLDRVGLADRAGTAAGSLEPAEKRALELALALASDPRLLLLDEPTTGLHPQDVDRTIALLAQAADGCTVVVADHDLHLVRSLADTVTVLGSGQVLAQGTYERVRDDERVVTEYLGRVE